MARGILAAAGGAWLFAATAAFAIAAWAVDDLLTMLPPLVIDSAAIGGAVVAMGAGSTALGAVHLAIVAALRRHQPRALSAAILLSGFLGGGFAVGAVACITAAVAQPAQAAALGLGAAGALGVAAAYAIAASRLVSELTSRARRPPSRGA